MALAIPVTAFWLTATLALRQGLGRGASMGVAIGLVVVLPLVWDVWSEGRYRQRENPPERVMSRADRIRLRILSISLIFLAIMLFGMNRTMTTAIAGRGDWFLDGAETPFAADLRSGLATVALKLDHTFGPTGQAPITIEPVVARSATAAPTAPLPAPRLSETGGWPLPPTPHPIVSGLTESRTGSIAEVAALIRAKEPDPKQRARAYHDFAIQHLIFDVKSLLTGQPTSDQRAETVFKSRVATAVGYANLVTALGNAAGDEVITVTGQTRYFSTEHAVFPHAWNAVALDGTWSFLDAARDAGTVIAHEFSAGYGTTWLFPPTELMTWDHLPDDPMWALPGAPRDAEALLAGTALSASAAVFGLSPIDLPTRLTVSDAEFSIALSNPKRVSLLATAWSPDDGASARCSPPSRDERAILTCNLGASRRWIIILHATHSPEGPYVPVGQLRVLHRAAL